MIRKVSATWKGNNCSSQKVFEPDVFNKEVKREKERTSHTSPTFDLLDYKVEGFDINQIRMAIVRAKQDYGKAFERLAAED